MSRKGRVVLCLFPTKKCLCHTFFVGQLIYQTYKSLPYALIALCCANIVSAGDDTQTTEPQFNHSTELRILSYNIKGLPSFLVKDKGRFKKIGQMLNEQRVLGTAPHVVFLQEQFSDKSEKILKHAKYPYVYTASDAQGDKAGPLGSGLTILSEYPVLEIKFRQYDACSSWDCFAKKGVLSILIQPEGMPEPILVMNTHLQASSKNDDVRIKQVDEFVRFDQETFQSDQHLTIFAGDFNSNPKRPSYHHFIENTHFKNIGDTCLKDTTVCKIVVGTNGGHSKPSDVLNDSKDQHFTNEGGFSSYNIKPIFLTRNFDQKYSGQYLKGFLSDHWGYEVHYKISW